MQRQIIVLFALWKITIYIFCLALFCLGLSIVRFCSKTSMAWLVIFCIISRFFCINLTGISNCVCWAHPQSASCQAAPDLQTEVCSVFVLFWNIQNRDRIIGRQRGIKSALSGGGKVELVDSMIVRAAGIMFNLFVIPQNWFRLAKKKSRHEIDQKRTQPISSHNKTQVGDEKKEDF